MEKKKDFLLVYLVLISVIGFFGWLWLKPTPIVYHGEILSIEHLSDGIQLTFGPANTPYPEQDINLDRIRSAKIGPDGVRLQIREAPDGTRLQVIDLPAMFEVLAPGDEVGFSYRDKAETLLEAIHFTTSTK